MDTKIWTDMFFLSLPVLEKILRSVIVYLFLVVGLRLAGKRELAQLNPFDLVVLLTLSNTVQNAIIGEDNSVTGGLIGAATLLGINYLVVAFSMDTNPWSASSRASRTCSSKTARSKPSGWAKSWSR